MKTFLTIVTLATLLTGNVLALTAGDLAIIAINCDNPDALVVVPLASIPANTPITFTDCTWSNTLQAFNPTESAFVWSNGAEVVAGTIIQIAGDGTLQGWSIVSGPGTIFYTDCLPFGSNAGFSNSGEALYAYEGMGWNERPTTTNDAKWLYALSTEAFNEATVGALPSALNDAAVQLTDSATETDNGYFADGTNAQISVTRAGLKAVLLADFNNGSNLYYKSNSGPLIMPTYSITVVPEPALLGVAGVAVLAFLRKR
ncbi:MAG: hypothetical protein NTV22_12225 [bacterium]|nr:hypothetical protein [bacterium]